MCAQRRTKRDAAATSANSHVRPDVNCNPAPPRASAARPASCSPIPKLAPTAPPSANETAAVPSERRWTSNESPRPTFTTSTRPPSRSRSVRARTRHGPSPAARASRGVQIPPATKQIPCFTCRATCAAIGGTDPTAAAPATTAHTTARSATYSAEAWPAMGVGEAQPLRRRGRGISPPASVVRRSERQRRALRRRVRTAAATSVTSTPISVVETTFVPDAGGSLAPLPSRG